MKRILGLFLMLIIFASCQDEDRRDLMTQPETEKQPDSIQVLSGNVVFGEEAAVIRGEDFVYGVSIDSMANELADRIAPLKSDDFEMIPVKVKAKILPNQARDGWEEIIEIREIIEVSEPEKTKDTITK